MNLRSGGGSVLGAAALAAVGRWVAGSLGMRPMDPNQMPIRISFLLSLGLSFGVCGERDEQTRLDQTRPDKTSDGEE